jgi:WD40-like Beta Propeller Repeat
VHRASQACKTGAGLLLLVWLVAGASCRPREPAGVELAAREDLPGPAWHVVARRDGKVLLARHRATPRVASREDPRRSVEVERVAGYRTLIFESGRHRDGPPSRPTIFVLPTRSGGDTLRLHSVQLDGRPVLFTLAGEAPGLHESPSEPGLYVAEYHNHLWLVTRHGATQLTADTAHGIAIDTLRAQQREDVRYLYWAGTPLWSPDGSAIAYVTNRTWMLDARGGQEVWLVEPRTRRERPLLSERSQFFAPQGWLESELVYQVREAPISAVDVRTGLRRPIAAGGNVTISPAASRMLYMSAAGDTSVRARVLVERGIIEVPEPPAGERLDYRGAFSPSGNRLLLGTSFARDSGMTRALYVFDVDASRLTRLMQWSHREGNRHPDGSPGVWLDESTFLVTQFDRNTKLESSMLVRLRPTAPSRR